MLGWLAGGFWAWELWHWLGAHADLSAQGLWLQDLALRLGQGGSLRSWDLPPSPALLPDLGLLSLLGGLGHDPERVQRCFGLILGLLAWKYLARLIRRLWSVDKGLSRVLGAAGLLLGLALGPLSGAWLLPGQHGGALVLALAAWSWGLKQKERPSGWGATLWGALALGLVGAGDLWALAWTLPVLAFLALRSRSAAWPRWVAGLLLALGSAYWGHQWLVALAGRVVQPAWPLLREWDGPALLAQGALWWPSLRLAGLLGLLALSLWVWPLEGRSAGLRVLGLGWWVLALGSAWAGLRLGLSGGAWLYPLWPLLWLLPALLVERWPAWDKTVLLGVLLAALLALPSAPPAQPSLTEQAQWLEASLGPDRRYGWADPARARGLRLASPKGLILAGVLLGPDGVQSPAWCADRSLLLEGAVMDRPEFVVVNGLVRSAVKARLGEPSGVFNGGGLELWVYQAAAQRLRRTVNGGKA
jgi:hypothetical protein